MPKRKTRAARPRAEGASPPAAPAKRSGQGAGSAYAEMLRRQAQVPRAVPGTERERGRPQGPTRSR